MTQAKTGAKGQGMVIDLMIAVLIFLLIMAAALAVWSNTASTASRRLSEREMRKMAENAFERLVRSSGIPENWEEEEEEECEGESLEAVGLAKRDRVLDANKVNQFVWRTQGSDKVSCEWESGFTKRKLLIEDNNYYFRLVKADGTDDLLENSYSEYLEAGVDPDESVNKEDLMQVKIRRSITYKGGKAIAELVLHRYRK